MGGKVDGWMDIKTVLWTAYINPEIRFVAFLNNPTLRLVSY